MAPKTPTGIPTDLILGDTWKFRLADFVDYPNAEGWTLKLEITGPRSIHVPDAARPNSTIAFATVGDDANTWVVTVEKGDTKALDPGDKHAAYSVHFIARMAGAGAYAGQEYTVADVKVVLRADPRTATGQYETHAEKMFALIEREIEARVPGSGAAHNSYVIEGRSLAKIPLPELVGLRGKYAALVQQERTGKLGREVRTVFGRAS